MIGLSVRVFTFSRSGAPQPGLFTSTRTTPLLLMKTVVLPPPPLITYRLSLTLTTSSALMLGCCCCAALSDPAYPSATSNKPLAPAKNLDRILLFIRRLQARFTPWMLQPREVYMQEAQFQESRIRQLARRKGSVAVILEACRRGSDAHKLHTSMC